MRQLHDGVRGEKHESFLGVLQKEYLDHDF